MSDAALLYETVLKLCAQAAPAPWYPSEFARSVGVNRDRFDPALNDLRMSGLIQLTPWEAGRGQGYVLTAAGATIVQSPRQLAALRIDRTPAVVPSPARSTAVIDERTPYGRGEAIRNALLFTTKPRVTHVLMGINILVFVVGLLLAAQNGRHGAFVSGRDVQALQLTGAVTGADLLKGEWWRLLTCCFVHFGFMHLFMNMYSLYVVGPFVEQLWGRTRYLAIYLVAGVGGSSVAMWANPLSHLAGASGALWGILGALAVWWLANRQYLPPQLVRAQLGQLLTVLIMNGVISFLPGISWTAHFAGGAVGAVVALLLHVHRFGSAPWRWLCLVLVPAVPVLCVGGLIRGRGHAENWVQIQQVDEVGVFKKQFRPQAEALRRQYEQFRRDDYPSLSNLERRRPAEVQRIRDQLLAMRSDAQKLIDALDAMSFRGPLVVQASQTARELSGQLVKLIDMVDKHLEAGQPLDEPVQRQLERTNHARDNWIKLLQGGE